MTADDSREMRVLIVSLLLALVPALSAACTGRPVRRDGGREADAFAGDAGSGTGDTPFPDAFLGVDAPSAIDDASIDDAFRGLDAEALVDAAARDVGAGTDALVLSDAYVPRDAFARDAFFAGDAFAGGTTTLTYTGSLASYVVPAGVTSLHVVADGASGGDASTAATTYSGGRGAHVDAIVTVTPGETLSLLVGQRPDPIAYLGDGCGASGGGGTYVVRGPSTALVVAGGGGGASAFSSYVINGADASTSSGGVSSGTVLGGTGG